MRLRYILSGQVSLNQRCQPSALSNMNRSVIKARRVVDRTQGNKQAAICCREMEEREMGRGIKEDLWCTLSERHLWVNLCKTGRRDSLWCLKNTLYQTYWKMSSGIYEVSCFPAGSRFSRKVQRKWQPRLELKCLCFSDSLNSSVVQASCETTRLSLFWRSLRAPILSFIWHTSVNWGTRLTSLLVYKDLLIPEFIFVEWWTSQPERLPFGH